MTLLPRGSRGGGRSSGGLEGLGRGAVAAESPLAWASSLSAASSARQEHLKKQGRGWAGRGGRVEGWKGWVGVWWRPASALEWLNSLSTASRTRQVHLGVGQDWVGGRRGRVQKSGVSGKGRIEGLLGALMEVHQDMQRFVGTWSLTLPFLPF